MDRDEYIRMVANNPIGILAPDGTLTPCNSYEHLSLASEMVENMEDAPVDVKCSGIDAEQYLQQLGYVIVRARDVYGLIGYYKLWESESTEQRLHLTDEQEKWLLDNYEKFPDAKRESVDELFERNK